MENNIRFSQHETFYHNFFKEEIKKCLHLKEMRDDYMEMREGLDLGYNFNPTTVVGILGNPWFTNSYVYWCLSALLLSWPLRIIIEYNTQYADYQVSPKVLKKI